MIPFWLPIIRENQSTNRISFTVMSSGWSDRPTQTKSSIVGEIIKIGIRVEFRMGNDLLVTSFFEEQNGT